MATNAEWASGYARQADADFETYEALCSMSVPACHKLQFLQMACEKLTKAHLCVKGSTPATLQASHAYVEKNLPIVVRQEAEILRLESAKIKGLQRQSRHLAQEIEALAPAVKRGGKRPDNCEYPWEDDRGVLHLPLDWSFAPTQFIVHPAGRTILKLIRSAINRLMC